MEQEEKEFNDLKNLAERFIKSAQKYIENTVEVTRTIRLPKGEYCKKCSFMKKEFFAYPAYGELEFGGGNGYVWCTLYGERLEIDKEKFSAVALALLSCDPLTYRKCEQCKVETGEKS